MPKLDLTQALRIKGAGGEIIALKGAGFAWVRPPLAPTLSKTVDAFFEVDGQGNTSLTVTAPPIYAGGPYATDLSTAAAGQTSVDGVEVGPECYIAPAISRTSGAADVVGSTYTAITALWGVDSDDKAVYVEAGEWYLDGVATGETGLTYTTDTAGDIDFRSTVTGAGAARTAVSNSITVAAADPDAWDVTGGAGTATATTVPDINDFTATGGAGVATTTED